MAVATSSDRELFIPTLERENIIDYFDDIVTVGEVERGKEFPDVYLEAAKRINADVEESVVFEDILTAIKGAKQEASRLWQLATQNLKTYRNK